ncbi:uncharacterized protein LOC111025203 [Momordica charantia]|uniref:Uncharacterized protein LOC111025203 n=1 Tax=Momordica charantia TaxID=3673 RepID=A0A6J1DWN2_MOMCH|nr:uncharacterized protein LOC111025203 [Momordica charantia]
MTQKNAAGTPAKANVSHIQGISYSFCEGEHHYNSCPSNPKSVYYLGNTHNNINNPYSNTYNQGWSSHPNFSWSRNQGRNDVGTSNAPAYQQKGNYPPRIANQGQGAGQKPPKGSFASLENLMKQYMEKNNVTVQSYAASLRNLELQVGQLATDLKSRPYGALPSDTKVSEQPKDSQDIASKEVNPVNAKASNFGTSHAKVDEKRKKIEHEDAPTEFRPTPPYPKRLKKKEQDVQFRKFLDVLNQLHVNIPLVEASEQMSTYVRFLKDILIKKRKLREYKTVAMTKESSNILISKIPTKIKDLGSFTIPISIRG